MLLLPTSLVTRKLVSKGSQHRPRARLLLPMPHLPPPFPISFIFFLSFSLSDGFSYATVYCMLHVLLLAERAKQARKKKNEDWNNNNVSKRAANFCSNRLVGKMLSKGIIQCGKFRLFQQQKTHTRVCVKQNGGSKGKTLLFPTGCQVVSTCLDHAHFIQYYF